MLSCRVSVTFTCRSSTFRPHGSKLAMGHYAAAKATALVRSSHDMDGAVSIGFGALNHSWKSASSVGPGSPLTTRHSRQAVVMSTFTSMARVRVWPTGDVPTTFRCKPSICSCEASDSMRTSARMP